MRTQARTVLSALVVVAAALVTNAPRSHADDGGGATNWVSERVDAPKQFELNHRALAFDSNGLPHAAYGGDFLYYAHHDGADWQIETILMDAGVGRGATMTLDAGDKAHILHADTVNARILYTTNVSGDWETEVVFTPPGETAFRYANVEGRTDAGGIAVGTDGTVHVTYDDTPGKTLEYATNRTGAWVAETLDDFEDGEYQDTESVLLLDGFDNAHVAYRRGFPCLDSGSGCFPRSSLGYATNATGSWVRETAARQEDGETGLEVSAPAMVLDSLGRVHIVYEEVDHNLIADVIVLSTVRIAHASNASGAWVRESVEDISGVLNSPQTSLVIDSQDRLHVALRPGNRFGTAPLVYASNGSGSWQSEELRQGVRGNPSIAIDAADNLAILQLDLELYYYDGGPGNWVETPIDETRVAGIAPGTAVAPSGDVHIVYQASESLMYGLRSGGTWALETIEPTGLQTALRRPTQIRLDANGAAHTTYIRRNPDESQEVIYATNASGAWVRESVYPLGTSASWPPAIALDANGAAHIISRANDPRDLRYATNKTGSWVRDVIVTMTEGIPGDRFAVDSNGAAHVLYVDSGEIGNTNDFDLYLATNASGSWVSTILLPNERIEFTSRPGIQVADDGSLHAVINAFIPEGSGSTIGGMGYGTNESGQWVWEPIPGVRGFPDFTIDGNADVHLSSWNGFLLYTTNASGVWRTLTLDTGAGGAREFAADVFEVQEGETTVSIPIVTAGRAIVGIDSGIFADPNGCVTIAYRDDTLGDLKLIEQTDTEPNIEFTIDLGLESGTATLGDDFAAGISQVGWAANDTSSRVFTIDITDDDLLEGTETATLRLTNAVGGLSTIGGRSTARLRLVDDEVAPADVDSYVLPKKIKLKSNTKSPTKSALTVVGFFDTGSGVVDLSGAAQLTVGATVIDVPGLIPQGTKFRYKAEGVDFTLIPAKSGSSKGKFKLKLSGADAHAISADAPIALRFVAGSVDGLGRVTLQKGGFKLGKVKGTLAAPTLFLFAAKAKLKGDGKDALTLKAGLGTLGGTPDAAPDVRVTFGNTFDATIPGGQFAKKGDKFVFKGNAGGIASAILDFKKEQLTVKVKNVDLGQFAEGPNPVGISVEAGAAVSVAVRMVRKKASLKY